ncbi:MAG: 8-oxo-dGTP diphosphatase [Candidatus Marsarchaeota archaeon]|jgi:8-oxo-dGTP pyrophosphatase MutT (NUDIX family)|nr:8-oxo-dGTP diphosphatase [Candidatus Marsarchaeota archaeon]MCL5419206.1 8-oxo-dGTP diphosphatase [Candidatus Marsarchaeota archaeon]
MYDLSNHPPSDALRKVSLAFIIDKENRKLLLAMKKRGFGKDRWNGYGGKQIQGESIEETAIRETKEEIGIEPTKIERVGTLNFFFEKTPSDADWNQQVVVFIIKEWKGMPSESEEMRPEWFDIDRLPFDFMWDDDKYWLPKVLSGKKVEGTFIFDNDQKLHEFEVKEL